METEQALERERWLAERRSGIGGSDAPAILGLSPYSNAVEVWADKMGIGREVPDREVMWWGRELEGLIRRRYQETTGLQVVKPDGMFRHPAHDCLLANVDGILPGQQRGLEIKTANPRMADQWGEPGTDQIPAQYVIQCCHYMMVTGYRSWDVAALIGGSDFRVYHLRADRELEVYMLETLVKWWQDYVVTGAEPPLDHTDASRRYLHRKFPREADVELAVASREASEWAARLAASRNVIRNVEEEVALAENNLKALIGEKVGMLGEGWKATWKLDRARKVVDWQKVASALAAEMMKENSANSILIEQAEAAATEERPGPRRFLFRSTEGAAR